MLLRILFACALLATQSVAAQDVRIGVLGLFRPREITVQAAPGQALVVHTLNIHVGNKDFVLERSSGEDAAKLTVDGNVLVVQVGAQSFRTSAIYASGWSNGAVDFELGVPAKIRRRYRGVLEVKAVAGVLVPVIQMDLETAVASVVQAESAPGTALEALKAQAIATRSYFLAASRRHHDFDFCDTTHCQFLRQPPPASSDASRAVLATRGLALVYRERIVAAMFTRSCGGQTRTPQEVGLSSNGYPYFPALCDYCVRHPTRWVRRVSQAEAADLHERGEASRLDLDRRFGWDAIPSNSFSTHSDARGVVLEGTGEGHGIGLCQAGAKDMAEAGATFREILEHYYPNTILVESHLK
jgi:peptidoglycan hydrolase-like amidase